MKKQIVNPSTSVNDAPHGQALAATELNDLTVSEANQADVKGGIVALEYLLLATVPPSQTIVKPK